MNFEQYLLKGKNKSDFIMKKINNLEMHILKSEEDIINFERKIK